MSIIEEGKYWKGGRNMNEPTVPRPNSKPGPQVKQPSKTVKLLRLGKIDSGMSFVEIKINGKKWFTKIHNRYFKASLEIPEWLFEDIKDNEIGRAEKEGRYEATINAYKNI